MVFRVKHRLTACIAIFVTVSANAHDFWVEPSSFKPPPDSRVEIRLREGMDFRGNTLPYIPEWFTDFSVVTANERVAVDSIPGDDPAAIIGVASGPTLIGYLSNRAFVELPAEKFNFYLEEEGIEFIRAERIAAGEDDAPAPEYFVRCAKTLLQSGTDIDDSVFGTTLGYTLELTPLSNPYRLKPGEELTFRLDYRGQPARNLLVQAFTAENPTERQRIRTDANGEATVRLTDPGTWMIKAVNIQPIIGDAKAKWQSYWASFLFELAGND